MQNLKLKIPENVKRRTHVSWSVYIPRGAFIWVNDTSLFHHRAELKAEKHSGSHEALFNRTIHIIYQISRFL